MDDKRYCRAITRSGGPCKAWANRATGLCSMHDINARQIQAKGGRSKCLANQLEKRLPTSLKPVTALLAQALEETHQGKLAANQASALAALAGAIVKCMEAGLLTEKIQALEEMVEHEQIRA